MVARRLTQHLEVNSLWDPQQPAYRRHHSCETAVVSLIDDVRCGLDEGKVTLLTLLDLSAAFDTVDHSLLVNRLSDMGVQGDALAWFVNYLSGRSQSVFRGTTSPSLLIKSGVPQGSVLGPILFTIYLRGLREVIIRHGVKYIVYADDIQLYITCVVSELPTVVKRMEACIADIQMWLTCNLLVLNLKKTEAILFGTRQQLEKCTASELRVGDVFIPFSSTVRDLGVF